MTFKEFHNRLRIMSNIDRYELVDAGIIEKDDERNWRLFRSNPWLWFIQASDEQAEKLWSIIETRMAK